MFYPLLGPCDTNHGLQASVCSKNTLISTGSKHNEWGFSSGAERRNILLKKRAEFQLGELRGGIIPVIF